MLQNMFCMHLMVVSCLLFTNDNSKLDKHRVTPDPYFLPTRVRMGLSFCVMLQIWPLSVACRAGVSAG